MNIRKLPVLTAIAALLSACAAPPDSFEGAYETNAAHYAATAKEAIHAYQRGEITQTEMQERLNNAASQLAQSDAGTARLEQTELSNYSHPPPPRVVVPNAASSSAQPPAETRNACLLIPCPESPPPAQNPEQ